LVNFIPEFMRVFQSRRLLLTPAIIWFSITFIIAVFLRCLAWSNTAVITPDGAAYIFQAKAIFYSQWKDISDCGMSLKFLTGYPFLIAAVYHVFPDWVIAGRAVNFAFGIATIIPLYLLLRQFLDYRISALTTLIVAVSPFFVGTSVDILRDPLYWFLAVTGLYLFTVCMKDDHRLFLFLSSLFFLLAAWTKHDGLILLAASFIYLLWQDRHIAKIFIFMLPVFAVVALTFIFAGLLNTTISKLNKVDVFVVGLFNIFSSYAALGSELGVLVKSIDGQTQAILKFFLQEAQMNVWLVALGTLMNRLLEASMYVFLIPFMIGFAQLKKIKEDPRLIYFLLLALFILSALYLYVIQTWGLQYRYTAIFTLSSIAFAGIGLETVVKWLSDRYQLKETLIIILLACMMLFFSLPKNMTARDSDKIVFKEIGEFVVIHEGVQNRGISVSAPMEIQRWISFYANLNYQGAVCPEASEQTSWEMFPSQENLVEQLKQRNIKYFLWAEKSWSERSTKIDGEIEYLKKLGVWRHNDTGKMILFEVI